MSRAIVYIICSLFCLIYFSNACIAQDTKLESDSLISDLKIPELDKLIDSALIHSPLLQMSDMQIAQLVEKIKIENKSWSNYFTLDANAKYGLYNDLTITDNNTTTTQNSVSIPSSSKKFNYFVGVSFSFPFTDIFTKKNRIKIINENIDEIKYRREGTISEIRQLVVSEYFTLIYLSKSLKVNQTVLQTLSTSLMKSERDIQSGLITMDNFNTILIQQAKAEETFYKTKSELFTQYKKLEFITGIKF